MPRTQDAQDVGQGRRGWFNLFLKTGPRRRVTGLRGLGLGKRVEEGPWLRLGLCLSSL